MVQSKIAPNCKKEDGIRDYEAMVNLAAPCNTPRNPSYLDHFQGLTDKNVKSVQAPAGSVVAGEVVVDEGQQEGVPLSAGFIAVVCICGIAILFLCVFSSEIKSGISTWRWRRRQRSMSISDRQDVNGDIPSSRGVVGTAQAEDYVNAEFSNPNFSHPVSSNRSSAIVGAAAGLNDSPAAGWKQGLAYWVIKGLPLFKYKKQKVQLPIPSFNSASSMEFIYSQNGYQQTAGVMIASGMFDHDVESVPQLPAHDTIHIDAAPDYTRLECVVCLSPFEDDEAIRVLPQCYHAFHAVCIDSWLLFNSTCPLCRAQVSSTDGCQE